MEKITSDWRYERKFVVDGLDFRQVEDIILENNYLFREIYKARRVNNIYLDDISNSAYFSNVEGLSERKKYRIRWYGDLFGQAINPVLEAKIKRGVLGTKLTYEVASFLMQSRFCPKRIHEMFKSSNLNQRISDELSLLSPSLVNSYHRKYFQSFDRSFRVTIDQDIAYYYISASVNHKLTKNIENTIVVEIKYNAKDDWRLADLTKQLPFRLSRNSKYVKGLSTIADAIY